MNGGDPRPGQIDLWYVPLADFGDDDQAACFRLLSPPERERHDAFRSESARLQHLAARGLVRTTLSRYRDVAPDQWRFETNRYGRPSIDGSLQISGLHFNLSHTHGMAVCAIASVEEIGVDVESRDRDAGLDELAATMLSRQERERFDTTQGQARGDFFFTLWTLKEAYVKARGMGLALPMNGILVDLESSAPAVHFSDEIADDPARWTFRSLPLEAGYIVGVAAALPADKLKIRPARTRAINLPTTP